MACRLCMLLLVCKAEGYCLSLCVPKQLSEQPAARTCSCQLRLCIDAACAVLCCAALDWLLLRQQVGSADPDTGTSQPGYRLEMQNVTRVCDYYVTAECIHQYTEDLCTADLLSRLLSPPAASDGTWQPQTIAGVVAGGACSGVHPCATAQARTVRALCMHMSDTAHPLLAGCTFVPFFVW
jgi:hypothetical protein